MNKISIPGFTAVASLISARAGTGSKMNSTTLDVQQAVIVPQLMIGGCFKLGRTSELGDIWICGVEDVRTGTSHYQIYYGGVYSQ